jgi:hypothetical protein
MIATKNASFSTFFALKVNLWNGENRKIFTAKDESSEEKMASRYPPIQREKNTAGRKAIKGASLESGRNKIAPQEQSATAIVARQQFTYRGRMFDPVYVSRTKRLTIRAPLILTALIDSCKDKVTEVIRRRK